MANKYSGYFQKTLNKASEIILLIAFTVLAYTCLLYLAKYMWVIYMATDVGQMYARMYQESYRLTNDILDRNFISLAFNLTLTSCVICFAAGAVSKFLHLIEYVYSGRGFLGRFIFAGLPLTYIVAVYIHYTGSFSHLDTALMVVFIPTSCVFAGCFRFAEEVVPGLTDLRSIFSQQQETAENKQVEVNVSVKEYASIQKSNVNNEKTFWQTMFRDILESFEAYIMVIFIIILIVGILLAIPKMQIFNKTQEQAVVPVNTAPAQTQDPIKEKPDADARFVAYPDKTVFDKKTHLMWAAEESETLNWYDAQKHCKRFRGGGHHDWRMPTIAELQTLYDESLQPGCACVTALIEIYNGPNCWEWSSETNGSEAAMFAFNLNGKKWFPKSNDTSVHIRPVRFYK
jgi:hypothetical protein